MRIEKTQHVDSSEPGEEGLYEYHYEYFLYRFTEGAVTFVARSYSDTPAEAHFLQKETNGKSSLLAKEDFELQLLRNAADHLREEGVLRLSWLDSTIDGYANVPDAI